jgi:hypothetical protein
VDVDAEHRTLVSAKQFLNVRYPTYRLAIGKQVFARFVCTPTEPNTSRRVL